MGQVGPMDCRGGTRGCVKAAQVTSASEQKEETWGRKRSKWEHQEYRISWHQRACQHQKQENPEAKGADSAPLGSYLQAVFSLAEGEGLQGTGQRRWAARRRCQQQSQQQAVEFTAAAGAGVRGAA